MKKPAKASIEVRGTVVNIVTQNETDYICLTDIARSKDPERTDYLISNWMRNRNTVEFLGIWEQLHNPGFNPIKFDGIKMQKINYRIHTDAIKDTLIPPSITKAQASAVLRQGAWASRPHSFSSR